MTGKKTFEIEQQTTAMTFADMPGLEVRTAVPSLGELLDIMGLAGAADGGDGNAETIRTLFTRFAAHLIEWNVTSGGKPVPATMDGLSALPVLTAVKLIRQWCEGLAEPDPTQGNGSRPGETPPPPGIPVSPLPDPVS